MRKTLTVALDIGNVCVRLEYENVFRAAGLEPGSALPEDAALTLLELKGYVTRLPGRRFSLTEHQ